MSWCELFFLFFFLAGEFLETSLKGVTFACVVFGYLDTVALT